VHREQRIARVIFWMLRKLAMRVLTSRWVAIVVRG